MKKTVSAVLLHTAYVVGIGPVSILFQMNGKKLLSDKTNESTWNPISGSDDIRRMY